MACPSREIGNLVAPCRGVASKGLGLRRIAGQGCAQGEYRSCRRCLAWRPRHGGA